MIAGARFVHTNLVANNWQSLVELYQHIFGMQVVPPERDTAAKN